MSIFKRYKLPAALTRRQRLALAGLIGLASGLGSAARLAQRGWLAGDFTWPWRAAGYLLAGQNPYPAIQPAGPYPFQSAFYYPLPAALAALPFARLPAGLAAGLFFGLSSALMAYGLSRDGWGGLAAFLSAPYWVAGAVAQWSPLLLAACLLPGLEWLLACKPNLGVAGFLYRPSWRGLALIAGFLGVSWLVLPAWPLDWLATLRGLEGHPPPFLILPFGPLLLLGFLHWRQPEGRLFLALSLLPQLLFFYDQLLLWLLPRSLRSGLALSALSWAAYFAWRLSSLDAGHETILRQPDPFILALIYLPALALLLARQPALPAQTPAGARTWRKLWN